MINRISIFSVLLSACCSVGIHAEDTNRLVIEAGKPGAEIPATLYGHFFEDINFGADGGLYAELVKNRSFEFPNHLQGWKTFGKVAVLDDGPFDRNPHYVRLSSAGHSQKHTGLENEGFFGIGIKEGGQYRFSVWARGESGKIRVELIDPASMGETQVLTGEELEITSGEWKKYTLILTSPVTFAKAHLRIFLESDTPVDLEHVSLFPTDTWKGRENGLRKDLVQALVDTKPGVFRFPGGCIVEGTDLATRYQWKNSVGPVENRPLNENRWQYCFPYRFYPDYYQTYGMGFYELFLLAEDMGAAPLPVLSCGLACQFQNNSPDAHVPVDSLDAYIQDALDLIEFANGGTDTKWGGLRAEMGHPAPFGLKFIGIGNEQWGPEYPARLKQFVEAIRSHYPDIRIVGSSGPNSESADFDSVWPDIEKAGYEKNWAMDYVRSFDYLWPEMKKLGVDLVDEHFYRPEDWFLKSGSRYDSYDRHGPKVFAGEYACHGNGKKWNHFEASLLEAAFLTGVERNADVVEMATYAPLLAHVEGWQWRPDLIWFDNLRSVRTCSWYVQSLYGHNHGTRVVPLLMDGSAVSGGENQHGLFASCVWDEPTRSYIVKAVNTSDAACPLVLEFNGLKRKVQIESNVACTMFHSDDLDAENTLDNPECVVPSESQLVMEGTSLQTELPAKTFAIYRFTVAE